MILGLLGDTHCTNKAPIRRLDDYWETQKSKIRQSIGIFLDHECQYITQTGDLVDNPNVSNVVMSEIINILNEYNINLHLTFGQHDIFWHSSSTIPSSPLSVFQSAGVVKIAGKNPILLDDGNKPHYLYGAGFGESVPDPIDPTAYNILVIHDMIGNRPLFPGQELKNPRQFLRNNPNYKLVICGDYHYRFISSYKDQIIINPGALVRKTIHDFDLEHEPAVVIFDTTCSKHEVVKLDVRPANEVFDMTKTEKRDNDSLNKFIDGLKSGNKQQFSWKHKLAEILNERCSSDEVKEIIDECMKEVNNE